MAKKKKPDPTPTPSKKLEVFALKRKEPTPEQDVEVANDAPSTPEIEATPPVVLESEPTLGDEVNLDPDPQPSAELLTPAPTTEVKPDAQPSTETLTPAPTAEVKTDVPAPTPTAKSTRPVLRKKSDRPADGETSSDAPTTPELLEAPPEGAMFQAVGVVMGDVAFNDEGKATLAFGGKEYPLYYAPPHKKAYEALKIEIKKTGVSRQRLLVYPRIIHFPKREEPHQVSFQLVAFRRSGTELDPNDAFAQLDDMEFKLAGLWQFIPVCQTPCVSVFKNYTTERKDFIKEAEVDVKVKFMKGSHVPLMWKDAPVRPFRFNPKLDKEHQGHAAFVQVKAVFVPDKGVFQVLDLTSTPSDQPPRFLKAGKKDRLQVAQDKLKASRGVKAGRVKPQVVKKIGIEATPNAKPTNDSQPEIG